MDYQYITPDIIDKGVINITSAAMHSEAERYNDRMRQFYRKKQIVNNCFPIWCIAQFALLGYCLFHMQCENDPSIWLTLRTAASVPYAFLYCYLILYRKNRMPVTALLVSLPLLLVAIKLIALLAANVILAHLYTKFRLQMEAEPGYPAFIPIKITYLNEYETDCTYG